MTANDRHISDEELVAFALGEAISSRSAEIDAHIDVCAACRDEYAGLCETLGSQPWRRRVRRRQGCDRRSLRPPQVSHLP